jgi:toxin ParE1/3/4
MRVRFTRRALAQLDTIFAHIAHDDPIAAAAVVARVEAVASLLGEFPRLGRPTDVEGVRMIKIPRYPYLLFYTLIGADRVRILRVRHAAMRE